ncbi:hypothetical protein ACFXKG_18330 [Streptomyces sp. NPDC059255]|uniref:hypothetical protein n=1 Tax=Streptomyces sp. NPDC059255 TaxID=3346793 RepID=UPI0036A5636D
MAVQARAVTIAALRRLLDQELPHVPRLPAPTLPRRPFSAKETPDMPETADTLISTTDDVVDHEDLAAPQHSTEQPAAPAEPLTTGALIAWAERHTDPTVRADGERAWTSLQALRERHTADSELVQVDTEMSRLEDRLAVLRARRDHLAPRPKKRGARGYEPRVVRGWALEQGMDVPALGPVPKKIVAAWRQRAEAVSQS